MSNHISNECPNRDVEYEYHYAGCDVKKPRPQLEKHMKDSVSLHFSLVSNLMRKKFALKENEVAM